MSAIKVTYKMMGKMRGLMSINTNPLDNPFCSKISKTHAVCSKCYSRKSLLGYNYKSNAPWSANGKALSSSVLSIKDLPKSRRSPIRLHAHGELINENHYINFMNIAKKNPKVLYVLWTKQHTIIQKFMDQKPYNLLLVYSESKINPPEPNNPPVGFDKVFLVYSKDYIQEHGVEINCQKKCVSCMKCYSFDTEAIIRERLK